MKKSYNTEDNTKTLKGWVRLYKGFRFGIIVNKAGYFDERPQVDISVTQLIALVAFPFLAFLSWYSLFLIPFILFGYGKMYINLPIRTGIQDCDSAAWGINYHNDTLWIAIGGAGNFEGGTKFKTFYMPWQYDWVRTSLLLKDKKSWVHTTKDNRLSFYEEQWKNPELVFIETHPYKYILNSGVEQNVNATITVEEMEWRPRWFKWTSMLNKVRKSINIEFSSEVGERTGTWKGGTGGCGYTLLPNETPLECLRRMEKERKF